jgi:hypothetical protein
LNTPSEQTKAIADHLRACEQSLLDPAVRKDRTRISEYLAYNFEEFGSSGRVWSRDEILDELADETPVPLLLKAFHCECIAEDVALVTYRVVRGPDQAGLSVTSLRSSIWTEKDGTWKLRFHQGTRIP